MPRKKKGRQSGEKHKESEKTIPELSSNATTMRRKLTNDVNTNKKRGSANSQFPNLTVIPVPEPSTNASKMLRKSANYMNTTKRQGSTTTQCPNVTVVPSRSGASPKLVGVFRAQTSEISRSKTPPATVTNLLHSASSSVVKKLTPTRRVRVVPMSSFSPRTPQHISIPGVVNLRPSTPITFPLNQVTPPVTNRNPIYNHQPMQAPFLPPPTTLYRPYIPILTLNEHRNRATEKQCKYTPCADLQSSLQDVANFIDPIHIMPLTAAVNEPPSSICMNKDVPLCTTVKALYERFLKLKDIGRRNHLMHFYNNHSYSLEQLRTQVLNMHTGLSEDFIMTINDFFDFQHRVLLTRLEHQRQQLVHDEILQVSRNCNNVLIHDSISRIGHSVLVQGSVGTQNNILSGKQSSVSNREATVNIPLANKQSENTAQNIAAASKRPNIISKATKVAEKAKAVAQSKQKVAIGAENFINVLNPSQSQNVLTQARKTSSAERNILNDPKKAIQSKYPTRKRVRETERERLDKAEKVDTENVFSLPSKRRQLERNDLNDFAMNFYVDRS